MKRLILLSKHFTEKANEALLNFTKKKPSDIKILFCANASYLYPEEQRAYVQISRDELVKFNFNLQDINLDEYIDKPEQLKSKIKSVDAIFFTGGNVFHLLKSFHDSGLVNFYAQLINEGLIHIGFSSGAMICSDDMKYYNEVDELELMHKYNKGLNLFPNYIFPHYIDKEKYTKFYTNAVEQYPEMSDKFIPLSNSQTIIVKDDHFEIG